MCDTTEAHEEAATGSTGFGDSSRKSEAFAKVCAPRGELGLAACCSQCAALAPWRAWGRNQILADLAADMDKFLRSTIFERTTISPAPRIAGGFYNIQHCTCAGPTVLGA